MSERDFILISTERQDFSLRTFELKVILLQAYIRNIFYGDNIAN